jgi:hypothetical protein
MKCSQLYTLRASLAAQPAYHGGTEELTMPTKTIDGYQIDFTAEPLPGTDHWGAYVAIFAPSDNPMHLDEVYARQRVMADVPCTSEAEAQAQAEQAAIDILAHLRAPKTVA